MTKQLSKEAWVVRYRTNYPDSKIEMIGQYVNSYSKTKFKCHKEHEWESTPCRVGLGGGCPRCSGKYRYKNTQEWMQAYKEKYTTSKIEMIGEYLNKRTKTKFKCHKGHVWETAPCHIMCGGNCPHCSRNYNYKNPIFTS